MVNSQFRLLHDKKESDDTKAQQTHCHERYIRDNVFNLDVEVRVRKCTDIVKLGNLTAVSLIKVKDPGKVYDPSVHIESLDMKSPNDVTII